MSLNINYAKNKQNHHFSPLSYSKKRTNIFCILYQQTLSIHKPSMGSCEVPHKWCAQSVQTYIVYKWTDTQTDKKSI